MLEEEERKKSKVRRKWRKDDNILLMNLYYRSKPDEKNYQKRLKALWEEEGGVLSSKHVVHKIVCVDPTNKEQHQTKCLF